MVEVLPVVTPSSRMQRIGASDLSVDFTSVNGLVSSALAQNWVIETTAGAAALAGAENDPVALKLAVATYESLLASASQPAQRAALENALKTLKNWSL